MKMNLMEAVVSLSDGGFFTHWMSREQRKACAAVLLDGPMQARDMLARLNNARQLIEGAPQTYEADGRGDMAHVRLHYRRGSVHAWITERDVSSGLTQPQHQAYGMVKIHEADWGYISIPELLSAGMELDLDWDVKTIKEAIR